MRNGLTRMKYFCFCILIKRQYRNSVILGSINQIAKKIGVSHYIASQQIKFGLKQGYLKEVKGGYLVVKYTTLFEFLELGDSNYSFCRFGNFQQLIERNFYIIARHNFKQQQYNIDQKERFNLVEKKIGTGFYITKKELKFYKNKKCVLSGKLTKNIVTGQHHLSKLLGVSSRHAFNLLKSWASLKLLVKESSFSKSFDRYENKGLLRLRIGNYVCDGTIINSFV